MVLLACRAAVDTGVPPRPPFRTKALISPASGSWADDGSQLRLSLLDVPSAKGAALPRVMPLLRHSPHCPILQPSIPHKRILSDIPSESAPQELSRGSCPQFLKVPFIEPTGCGNCNLFHSLTPTRSYMAVLTSSLYKWEKSPREAEG